LSECADRLAVDVAVVPRDCDGEQTHFSGTVEDPIAAIRLLLGIAFDAVAWSFNETPPVTHVRPLCR